MAECPAVILSKLMREESGKLLSVLAENVEALVGQSVEIKPLSHDSKEMAELFGSTKLYYFPVENHQSECLPSLLLMDVPAAVHAGAAFSLMGAEQVKEVLESGEIPEVLHDSIGEVANILCGAAVNVLRESTPDAPEYRRGDGFEVKQAPAWPGILAEVDSSYPWDIAGGLVLIDGEQKGGILLASSDRAQGMISAEQVKAASGAEAASPPKDSPAVDGEPNPSGEPAPAESTQDDENAASQLPDPAGLQPEVSTGAGASHEIPPGLKVHISCHPADPGARALKTLLEEAGARVLMATPASSGVEVLFVISRSPTDMSIRLRSLAKPSKRPGVVLACSDRPTRDLVVAARSARVDNFVVLPTRRELLAELIAAVPQPA